MPNPTKSKSSKNSTKPTKVNITLADGSVVEVDRDSDLYKNAYNQGNIMTKFGEDSYVAPELDEFTITSETDKERRDAYLANAAKYFREEKPRMEKLKDFIASDGDWKWLGDQSQTTADWTVNPVIDGVNYVAEDPGQATRDVVNTVADGVSWVGHEGNLDPDGTNVFGAKYWDHAEGAMHVVNAIPAAGLLGKSANIAKNLVKKAASQKGLKGLTTKNQVLTQQERLLNEEIKKKFFRQQAELPIEEIPAKGFNLNKVPKDMHNRITPENYEEFVNKIHGSTGYQTAKKSNKLPTTIGVGSYSSPGTVFTDATLKKTGKPLSNIGKDVVAAHEKNHGVFHGTLSEKMKNALLKPFKNGTKLFEGYGAKDWADEVFARMGQMKNALGFKGNEVFTKKHLDLLRKDYTKYFIDNSMSKLFNKLTPGSKAEKEFIKNMNKYAFGAATVATGAASQKAYGGYLPKNNNNTNEFKTGGIMPDTDPIKKLTDKEYQKRADNSKHYFNYSGSRSNAGVPTNYNERVEFYPGVQDGVRQYEDIEGKLTSFNSLIAPVRAAFLARGRALTTAEAEAISPGIGALEQEITDWMGTQSTMKGKVPSFTGNTEIESGLGLSAQRGQTMWGPMRTSQSYGVNREPFDWKKERRKTPGSVSNAGEIQQEGILGPTGKRDLTQTSLNREVQTDNAAYINNPYLSQEQILRERKKDAKSISKTFHAYGGELGDIERIEPKGAQEIQTLGFDPAEGMDEYLAKINLATYNKDVPSGNYTREMEGHNIDYSLGYNPTTREEGLPYKSLSDRFKDLTDPFTRKGIRQTRKQSNIQYGVGGDIGAGIYGAAEGVLDTATFGLTDKLTDKVKFNDPQSEAIRAGANVAGNVAGAFLNPAAVGTAVSQSGDNLKDLANTGVIENDNLNTALNVVGTGAEIGGGFIGGGAGGGGELGKFAQGTQDISQNRLAQTAMGIFGAYGGYMNKYNNGGPFRTDGPLAKPQGDIYLPLDGTRPSYTDASGKERSEYKIGIGTEKGEMVIPTVWDGEQHTEDEAVERYFNTGEHMGGPYGSIEEGERAAKLRTNIYNEHPAYRKENAYGGPINPYACGGKMRHGDGGNLSNTTKYNGLTHEQGGLPLGNTNNEVEDGEVRWDNNGESWIFTNRF